MQKVIDTHSDVEKAMKHPELGWISFIWGRKGKRGYGVSHNIERRDAESDTDPIFKDQKEKDVALRLPIIIAKGTLSDAYQQGSKRNIDYSGYRLVLRLDKDWKNERWITGYRISKNRKNPDEIDEVQQFIQSYASESYIVMRTQMGAGFNDFKATKKYNISERERINPNDPDYYGIDFI